MPRVEQLWFEGMEDGEDIADDGQIIVIEELEEEVEQMAENGVHATNTQRSLDFDWKGFKAWCRKARYTDESGEQRRISPLPCSARAINAYVAYELKQGRKTVTIARRLWTINMKHKAAGHPPPVTKKALALLKAKRREGKETTNAKAAFTVEQLFEMSKKLGHDTQGTRNRAIILTGVAIGSRRSELVNFDLADVEVDTEKRYSLYLRKSKRDQEYKGRAIGMFPDKTPELCPERALRAWLKARGDWPGALFTQLRPRNLSVTKKRLGMDTVNKVVKRCATLIGLDAKKYSSHSLRVTCVTTAYDSGAQESQIMKVTGHKSSQMVRRYHRDASPHAYNIHAGRAVMATAV